VGSYLRIEVKVAGKAVVECEQVPARCSQGSTKAIYGRPTEGLNFNCKISECKEFRICLFLDMLRKSTWMFKN